MKHTRDGNQGLQASRMLCEQARQQFSMGNVEQAESLLNRALSNNPRDTQALVALGIVAAQTGRIDLALNRMGQALQADRNCTPAVCWMSFILLQNNRPSEARQYAEQARAMEPRNPATHAALARCLSQMGLHADSIPSFQEAVRLDPNNPVVLYEYADALLAARGWLDARDVLIKAVQMAPDTRGLLRLGYLELRIGNLDDAARYCQRVLRREPNLSDANMLMARILTEQLKVDEAERHWTLAMELAPDKGAISLEKALGLSAIGRFDEAIAELHHSIEATPIQGSAYQALTSAKRIGPDDLPLVRKMEWALEQSQLADRDRVSLLYSLGKAYDNLGDYEAAMAYFDRANRLKRESEGMRPFDRAAFSSQIDAKIKLFTKDLFANSKAVGSDSAVPIWVVGMMRSGTTLAEQILTCHPKLGGAGEQTYWGTNENSMVDYRRLSVDPSRVKLCAKEYASILSSVAPGYAHVIDKNPANVLLIGSFHLAFPSAPIIHIRRSAIDTALSIWMTPINTSAEFVSDRSDIVFAYKEYLRLMEHFRNALPSDRFLETRYEDIVSNPDKHIREMVQFCGVEWDDSCLHPNLNERQVRTPSLWQVRQPFFKSSTDKWKIYEPWLGAFEELKALS